MEEARRAQKKRAEEKRLRDEERAAKDAAVKISYEEPKQTVNMPVVYRRQRQSARVPWPFHTMKERSTMQWNLCRHPQVAGKHAHHNYAALQTYV